MNCSKCSQPLPAHNPRVGVKPEHAARSECVTCPRCRARRRQEYALRMQILERQFIRGLRQRPVTLPEPEARIAARVEVDPDPLHGYLDGGFVVEEENPARLRRTQRFCLRE